MKSGHKLPPIEHTEDIQKYSARVETKEVDFKNCKHTNVRFKDGDLVCDCGASWSGPRLDELYKLLKKG